VLEKSLQHADMEISGDWFSDTVYADDIATMDMDPQSLAATLADIEHACGNLELHISCSKTKIQNVGDGSLAQTMTVDGQQVEGVDKFTYLGSQWSSADESRSDQRRRMGIAASTLQRMSHVWRQSHLTLATQLRLYMSLVVSILLYASDTWTTTSADLAHLHIRCQCRIINVRWYERVTNVYRKSDKSTSYRSSHCYTEIYSLRSCRPSASRCSMQHGPQDVEKHFHETPSPDMLETSQGSTTLFLDQPDQVRHRGSGSDFLETR